LPRYQRTRDMCTAFSSTDPATTALSPLSLHDALPIWFSYSVPEVDAWLEESRSNTDPAVVEEAYRNIQERIITDAVTAPLLHALDRKSTRLNSSHVKISYAVFCLKKKNKN